MNTVSGTTKIICVIPTFNRVAMLEQCLDSIGRQTRKPDHLVVVDNHSNDGTAEWLAALAVSRDDITVVRLDNNTGGAGGYHYGIKKAFELGADWIWTLDDDAVPEPSALERLLDVAANSPDIGFLASHVLWKDGTPHVMNVPGFASNGDQAEKIRAISYCSFVSALFNRRAICKAGYPVKEFFLHSDDVEFTRRITTAGFAAYAVEDSGVFHATSSNTGITLDHLDIGSARATEWQYTIRNLIAVNRRRPLGWLREPARLCVIFLHLLVSTTPWSVKLSLLRSGLSGLFMQYEKWIEYPADNAQ